MHCKFALFLALALALAAPASVAQEPAAPINGMAFLQLMSQVSNNDRNPTREEVLAALTKPIRVLDRDRNGLDRDDAGLQERVDAAQMRAQMANLFLPMDLDGDMSVTKDDGNGILDMTEIQGARNGSPAPIAPVAVAPTAPRTIPQSPIDPSRPSKRDEVKEACAVPDVPKGAQVVLVGAYEGQRYASVHFGDITQDVGYAEVVVEAGKEPIYVLLTEYSPIVWRFTGQTQRIAQVVMGGHRLGGVVGVPKEKVDFLDARECIESAHDFRSFEGVKARGDAKRLVGQDVVAGGTYGLNEIAIPSMNVAEHNTNSGLDRAAVQIDPETVVAATKVSSFEVLPGHAGLKQLVAAGMAEATNGRDYRIVKPIPHFPAGLHGGYSVRFIIAKGIPMPAGDPGHSCVLMEETGDTIGATCSF